MQAPATDGVVIRVRVDDDLEVLTHIVLVVHERDGYPAYLPTSVERFLVSPDALCAWVAVADDVIVGHVALHLRSTDPLMDLVVATTGLRREEIAVVARLFVSPDARRLRIGRMLLDHAADEARALGRRPVLDVVIGLAGAVALYESAGWERIGTVTFVAPSGDRFDEYAYTAPPLP